MAAKKKKAAKKAAKKPAKKKAAKKTAKKKSNRKPNAAFMAAVTPSAELAAVVGDKPMPRTEITKKLWVYIKKNGLQDKVNRRNINENTQQPEKIPKGVVNMFEMTKLISKHVS